VNSSVGEKS